eukprot:TRINITY_DN33528_c0_g1_i1.p1 TRINITY_DN33528_c0_g1~~TRINITY_DN33528_c0_g1_i1.p1  ORF type:complete len:332 (+),score=55.69 TRINITY_DN33528_c0_g1_i1:72-1067(+)
MLARLPVHRPLVQRAFARVLPACQLQNSSGLWHSSPLQSGSAAFATTAFTVPAHNNAPELTLFVVGLNSGKFFGQDGAEEGLKLVEHVASHSPEYTLLFGLSERDLAFLEEDHKVTRGRLTPSRELEGKRLCEHVPLIQAGMVDKRPRRALDRSLKITQNHVSVLLWKNPREAVQIYWAYWKRKKYTDAARKKFWKEYFPESGHAYFEDRAELITIRAVEHLAAQRKQGLGNTAVLTVNNELYELVVVALGKLLDKEDPGKLTSQEFLRELRRAASEICADAPDLTPLLVFVYGIMPVIVLQFFYLGAVSYAKKSNVMDELLSQSDTKARE